MGRHFTTDCEGPISKNDNAQELSAHFIPRGETFFAIVSKYDDFLRFRFHMFGHHLCHSTTPEPASTIRFSFVPLRHG